MNFYIFADGYLQENEDTFCYTIANDLFHTTTFDEHLKASNDRFGLELIDINRNTDDIEFVYKKEEAFSLLADVKEHSKPKVWKKKRDWLAYSITHAIQQEENKNLFVLPIPENFLVSTDSVKFIYKAMKDMPITGFDPVQLFIHVKRLILYLYSEESFSELLEQKETKTSDPFLVSIANALDFEALLALIPYEVPQTVGNVDKKIVQPKKKKEPTLLKKESKPEKVKEAIKHVEEHSEPHVSIPLVSAPKVPARVESKGKLTFIIALAFLGISLAVNAYLFFDKLTYPSQVSLLKSENKQLIEKVEKNEEKITSLEEENETFEEKLKKQTATNKELEEEIKTNVTTIKALVDKNEELKKSIKK